MMQNYVISSGIEEASVDSLSKTRVVANEFRDTYYTTRRLILDEKTSTSLQNQLIETPGRVLIIDQDDRVVLDTANIFPDQKLKLKQNRMAMHNVSGSTEVFFTKQEEHLMYTSVPFIMKDQGRGVVLLVKDIDYIYSDARNVMFRLMSVGGLFVLISSFFVMLSIYQLLQPVRSLSEGVDAMTRGNYSHRIKASQHRDELGLISRSFNLMAGRLDEIYKQQSEFVSNVSHELKTPIASMKIITQSLLADRDNVEKDLIFEFLEDINSETDRMQTIVEELLYIAKLEKNDMKLNLELRSITKPLIESIRIIEPLAKEKNITIELLNTTKYVIEFDYNKIKQVFINLLSNAIKYSPENTMIFIHVEDQKSQLKVDIIDHGFGIPEEDIPYVFDRFYRVDKARSRQEGGSGLGLNIVKRIINLHHGTIGVESRLNHGSTFSMTLPKRYQI